MLAQILIGALVSAVNIVIHALLTVSTIRAARDVATRGTIHPWLRMVAIMIATMLVLMAAHTAEVFVWSVVYAFDRGRARGLRPRLFLLRQLHHAGLRRHHAGRGSGVCSVR